jgi:hypothetical protein
VAGLSAVAARRGIPSPRALYLWAKDTRDKSGLHRRVPRGPANRASPRERARASGAA